MTRRDLLFSAPTALAAQKRRPPNIVLFLLDDAGYGDLGCYGQKLIQTPHIDAFARESLRFTDAYAGGAVCAPSRSVLMTGLHTGHTPVRANAGTIPLLPGDLTVAQHLKKAGYRTGGFGKWGLGDAGTAGAATRKGFDEFFGYLHQTHAHDYYPEYLRDGEEKHFLEGNRNGGRREYSADLIHNRALSFLKSSARAPFFLYVPTTLPHGRFELPGNEPYSRQPWSEADKNFAAMVTRADRHFGEILRALRELKLERDTLVMCASDNGGTGTPERIRTFNSTGPSRAKKGAVYEGGIRVPLIVRWPGHIKTGSTTPFPTSFCDFLPTALEAAGAPVPGGLDGVSLLPTLSGRAQKREGLYWEQSQYNRKSEQLVNLAQASRIGDWKGVIPKPGAPLELYNLQTDPGESKNLAERHPDVTRRIADFIKAQHHTPRPHNTGNWEYGNET